MSRPARPFRSTQIGPVRTTHYDYATKEERASWHHTDAKYTTVTSRKPLVPGTPVCWLNVFNNPREFTIYGSKEAADEYALANQRRIACIPVYLPGEGAEPVTEQMRAAAFLFLMQGAKDRQRIGELESEVERLTKELAAAQAQAMPAGKVVYGARQEHGDERVERQYERQARRDQLCPKHHGWTWFTRVEES